MKRGSITQIGQDWATTTLNALESPCDPQRSTVTHIHRKLNGTLAKKNYTIVDCGIARYGVYHFVEAIPRRKHAKLSCGSALARASVTDKTSNAR